MSDYVKHFRTKREAICLMRAKNLETKAVHPTKRELFAVVEGPIDNGYSVVDLATAEEFGAYEIGNV